MTHDQDQHAIDYCNQLASDPRAAHLGIMRQRRKWLTARIAAKQSIGWQSTWDRAERDALEFAIQEIEKQ